MGISLKKPEGVPGKDNRLSVLTLPHLNRVCSHVLHLASISSPRDQITSHPRVITDSL
jgi:hypothetical protein